MRTATIVLTESVDTCWRAFTDATLLLAWVPGLRRATVISRGGMGLAREILFEFAESRTYTLLYDYDLEAHEVRWEPQLGKRDAVRGHARFGTTEGGTRLEYALEQGDGRSEAERALGNLDLLVGAFAGWLAKTR
jgi:uncharacterized protein YndB with AHSA1/START domain